jgi:YVTN family beta-propeller protein
VLTRRRFLALSTAAASLAAAPARARGSARRLFVANTSGDTLSVIDLDTRVPLSDIRIGSHPHGLAVSPDQRTLYCTVESEAAVKLLDTASGQTTAVVPLSGVPNQLAVTPDGKWLYVAINNHGTADVVDVAMRKVVKSLQVGPSTHNCYAPKGGKFAYVTSIGGHLVNQYDYRRDHALTKTIRFDGAVRPLCVTRDDTRLFVALEGLHGFGWADLRTGQQVGRMERPLPPPDKRSKFAYMNTHGLELRPGDRELWVTSFIGNGLMVYDITRPMPEYVTTVAVGDAPNWLTFSPDGKHGYSANAGSNSITLVDCDRREAVKEIKVGPVPKRLLEVHVPSS